MGKSFFYRRFAQIGEAHILKVSRVVRIARDENFVCGDFYPLHDAEGLMIEFTILLDDSTLHFEPVRSTPDLAFMLPPTARIGRDNDIIHLAPIPVHCFFNAMSFGHWVQGEHNISECDAFVTYLTHDMFKALLHLIPSRRNPNSRTWSHQFDNLFQHI